MKKSKLKSGQTAVLFALVMVGLFGFVALAIDGGMALSERTQSQAVSDSIALTAAQSLIANGFSSYVATTEALALAAAEGFDNDGTDNSVSVVITGPFTESSSTVYYVDSKITSKVSTTFARLFVSNDLEQTTDSKVRIQVILGTGPMFEGYGIVALDGGVNYPISTTGGTNIFTGSGGIYNPNNFKNTGGALINTEGGTIYIENDLDLAGGAIIYTEGGDIIAKNDTTLKGGSDIFLGGGNFYSEGDLLNSSVQVIGGGGKLFVNGNLRMDGTSYTKIIEFTVINVGGTFTMKVGIPPENLSYVTPLTGMPPVVIPDSGASAPTLNTPDCSALPSFGSYSSSGDMVLDPGIYDSISINSGDKVVLNPGMYCVGGDIRINGGADVVANEVFIYMFADGDFVINGASKFEHTAPISLTDPSGNEWGGMALYIEPGFSNKFLLNGNNVSSYSGTFYAPDAGCTVTGGVDPNVNLAQIICATVDISGGTTLTMTYDADVLYDGGGMPLYSLELVD